MTVIAFQLSVPVSTLADVAPSDWSSSVITGYRYTQLKSLLNASMPCRPLWVRVLACNSKAQASPARDGNVNAPMVSSINTIQPCMNKCICTLMASNQQHEIFFVEKCFINIFHSNRTTIVKKMYFKT